MNILTHTIFKLIFGIAILSFICMDAIGQQSPHLFSYGFFNKTRVHYLLYLPVDYEKSNQSWPLMLFLHGAGERGTNLDLVKKHGPPMLVENGQQFPFIILSPQCAEDHIWSSRSLIKLIRYAMKTYHVNKGRIYVTGISMGGHGTWELACKHPDYFAAIAPVCGYGNPSKTVHLKKVPVWVFHGARDDVVPVIKSEVMVNALKKEGGQVRFTIYPDAGHDAWTDTYNNPELYKWLLEQYK
ncbi:MAG: prolyl oligopeptidase family serine peptidase [Bacteroidetes bacterium]|nr:prolyl oligopeptidase family serine peptidase [Bacteroidota bacterium]